MKNQKDKFELWDKYGLEDGISAANCWKKFRTIRPYENITHGYQKVYFDAFILAFLNEITIINNKVK